VTRLSELVAWLSGFEDPEKAYLARLQQVAEEPEEAAGGIGLARIAYEGRCRVDWARGEDGRVHVTARYPLERLAS
jgi:hypothetical protein